MNIVIVALGITSAMSLFAVLALLIVTRRTKRAVQSQAVHIDSLQNELNAMCSGAVGLGQHLASLEAQLKKLGKRQEQLELKEPSQTSYKYALKMARDGAGLQDVIHDCGIAEGEAELVMLASRMGK